jgi:hypothetical protein
VETILSSHGVMDADEFLDDNAAAKVDGKKHAA